MKPFIIAALFTVVTLSLYAEEVIHGHTLPPVPDPALNSATLGGIDSNHNGVRDDVERAIYKKYKKKLHAVLMMDTAKFFNRVLKEPISNAQSIVKYSIQNGNCEAYIELSFDNTGLENDNWLKNSDYVRNLSFDTPKRVKKYLDYNQALSGGVYGGPISDWNRKACSKEVVEALEEMGL